MSNRHISIPVFHNHHHHHFHLDHHYSLNVKASSSVSIPYRLPNHVPFLPSGSWWHCHDDDNREDDLHNENDHDDGNDVEDQNLSTNRVQLDVHCSDPHRDSGRWMRAWSRRSRLPGYMIIGWYDDHRMIRWSQDDADYQMIIITCQRSALPVSQLSTRTLV